MLRKKKVQMTETASATVPVTDVEEYLKGIRFQEDDFEFQHMVFGIKLIERETT